MIAASTRCAQRTAVGVAALIAIAISGITACSSSDPNEVIVSGEPAPAPTQAPTPAPVAGTPTATEQQPAPLDISLESGLDWTEVDLSEVFDLDQDEFLMLESVGDGRVLAIVASRDVTSRVLVTDDGMDWAALAIPTGLSPFRIDISGERWVIQGWDIREDASDSRVFFSDDQGSNWTELVVDLGRFDGTAWIANATVAGRLIVVAVQSDTWRPDIEDAPDDDMAYEPSDSSVHLFLSDGGPAELVAEFPGWASGGHGASDGFHLLMYGPAENYLLDSPDGRQWTRTIVDVEITDSALNEIWTEDPTDGRFKVERFEGVFGTDQVLTLPDGIGWMPDLAVGPAGVASVGGPEPPYDESAGDFTLPDFSFEKDGYEIRYNQPEGGITLWDLESDSAVYVFDAETLQREEEPPEGVQEVEGDDGSTLVVFHDPETGAELVAFPGEDLANALMEATLESEEPAAYRAYDPDGYLIGWSADGTDWDWQTLQEAFSLPESTPDDNTYSQVQVAVGHAFVIAQVRTFEFLEADLYEDAEVGADGGQSDSTSVPLTAPATSPQPPRWFIATVG